MSLGVFQIYDLHSSPFVWISTKTLESSLQLRTIDFTQKQAPSNMQLPNISLLSAGIFAIRAVATAPDPVLFTYTYSHTLTCRTVNATNPLEFRQSQLPASGCVAWSTLLGTTSPVTSFLLLDTINNGVCTGTLVSFLSFSSPPLYLDSNIVRLMGLVCISFLLNPLCYKQFSIMPMTTAQELRLLSPACIVSIEIWVLLP